MDLKLLKPFKKVTNVELYSINSKYETNGLQLVRDNWNIKLSLFQVLFLVGYELNTELFDLTNNWKHGLYVSVN